MIFRTMASVAAAATMFAVYAAGQTASTSKEKCLPPKATHTEDLRGFIAKGRLEALISILVDEKGAVSDTQVVQSSGNYDFDTDDLTTARKWKFKPSTCDGKPRSARINVKYTMNGTQPSP